MKKNLLVFLPLLFTATLSFGQWLDTVRIQQTGLDGTTPVSTDDAEQINNEIDKLYDDDLDMGWEGDEFNVVSTGLRFQGVGVPQGATIDSAYLEIWSHEDEGDPALITIYAEASDNAVTYDEVNLISDRPKTTASVYWECTEEWTIWTKYRTPDLTALVQEVVDRNGWQQGNAMAFYLTGQDQGASDEDNARDFESFENVEDPDDGGDGLNHPERIPKLFIYFSGVSASNDRLAIADLQLSPNPVSNGSTTLGLGAFMGENATASLIGADGRLVQNWQLGLVQSPAVTLDLPAAPGAYFLRVVSEKKVGVVKVTVI